MEEMHYFVEGDFIVFRKWRSKRFKHFFIAVRLIKMYKALSTVTDIFETLNYIII
jgi:hypothetical protein